LGFTIVALATRALPVPSTGRAVARSAQTAARPRTAAWRRKQSKQPSAATDIPKTRKLARLDHVRGFLQARTIPVEGATCGATEGATCGATELYEAFRRYCQRQGIPEASQQALGRELTRLGLTKGRCSRTGRFAYLGLALNDRHKETIAAGPILTTNLSKPKVQQRAAGMANGTANRNVRNAGLASRVHAMATA
jgi:phage/plasmid-associated DNA primase